MSLAANHQNVSANTRTIVCDESIISSKRGDHQSRMDCRKHRSTQRISPTWVSKRDLKGSMMASAAREHE
jgi:hypothetical protein